MQFVDGKDLSGIVQEHGPLPMEQAVECIVQAARGLEYAQQAWADYLGLKLVSFRQACNCSGFRR